MENKMESMGITGLEGSAQGALPTNICSDPGIIPILNRGPLLDTCNEVTGRKLGIQK